MKRGKKKMKSSQIRKQIRTLQEQLKRKTEELDRLRLKADKIYSECQTLLKELNKLCSELGKNYNQNCPLYYSTLTRSYCLLTGVTDLPYSYRMCINCRIPRSKRELEALKCHLTGRIPREE